MNLHLKWPRMLHSCDRVDSMVCFLVPIRWFCKPFDELLLSFTVIHFLSQAESHLSLFVIFLHIFHFRSLAINYLHFCHCLHFCSPVETSFTSFAFGMPLVHLLATSWQALVKPDWLFWPQFITFIHCCSIQVSLTSFTFPHFPHCLSLVSLWPFSLDHFLSPVNQLW